MVYLYDDARQNPVCFWESAKGALKNQLCVTLPSIIMLARCSPHQTEPLGVSMMCLPLLVVATDLYFYVLHRALHTRRLWKWHKAHHTGQVRPVKALDADAPEHLMVNLGSFACGFVVSHVVFGFAFHRSAVYVWTAVSTLNTCWSHCPELDGENGSHVLHHKHLKCNYGVGFYIGDRLLGSKR